MTPLPHGSGDGVDEEVVGMAPTLAALADTAPPDETDPVEATPEPRVGDMVAEAQPARTAQAAPARKHACSTVLVPANRAARHNHLTVFLSHTARTPRSSTSR
jgi:hypothetical protein